VAWLLLAVSAGFAALSADRGDVKNVGTKIVDVPGGDAVRLGLDHGGEHPAHDVGKLIVGWRTAGLNVIPSVARDLSGSSKGPSFRSG
jgi:hypothetical protein